VPVDGLLYCMIDAIDISLRSMKGRHTHTSTKTHTHTDTHTQTHTQTQTHTHTRIHTQTQKKPNNKQKKKSRFLINQNFDIHTFGSRLIKFGLTLFKFGNFFLKLNLSSCTKKWPFSMKTSSSLKKDENIYFFSCQICRLTNKKEVSFVKDCQRWKSY
jgi:hypothetical protein